jgi:hypothetical protein
MATYLLEGTRNLLKASFREYLRQRIGMGCVSNPSAELDTEKTQEAM